MPELPAEPLAPPLVELSDPRAYGRSFSETYDSWYASVTNAEATARFVAARTEGGIVLELGVGTGRLATAMQAAGLDVIGLDASDEMLTRCPSTVHRVLGDMATPPVRAGASLTALCGFNTVFNLTSPDRQALMFQRLRPVTQTLILETSELDSPNSDQATSQIGVKASYDGSVVVTATSTMADPQAVVGAHLEITHAGVVARPWMLRWATVAQLDAMAANAGFRRSERYSSWEESPWAADNKAGIAISVYR